MYTEENLTAINAQLRKRWLVLGGIEAVLLAGVICSLVIRNEILTTVLTVLMAFTFIFAFEMLLRPLRRYRKHLDGCLHGPTHTLDAPLLSYSETEDVVDGVRYHPITVAIQDQKGRDTDRLFYFDSEIPWPGYEPGQMLHIIYHDRELVDIQPLNA